MGIARYGRDVDVECGCTVCGGARYVGDCVDEMSVVYGCEYGTVYGDYGVCGMSDDYASAGKSAKVWVGADVDVATGDVGVYECVGSAI